MTWVKHHTALVLFFVVLCVGILLSPSAGVTWDEPDNIFAGGTYITFVREGFNPHAFDGFWDQRSYFRSRISTLDPRLSHYPPVPTYLGSIATIIAERFGFGVTGLQVSIIFHWVTALFFALLVSTTYRFARLLGLTPFASLFSAIGTYLYPALFGHGLTNLKDTAQVALFTLALFYLVRGSTKDLLVGSFIWGIGLASKFNAVYVPVIWGLWILTRRKYSLVTIGLRALLILVVGLTTAFSMWPYLWFDTLPRVTEVLRYFTTVGQGYRIIWDGVVYVIGIGKSYWWYPWASFLYGTPLLLLGALACGNIGLILSKNSLWIRTLLLGWIAVPMLRTLLPWTAYYDQIRHFMEILPPIMIIAGIGIDWLHVKLKVKYLTSIVAGAVVLQLIFIAALYFPYSTGYYNEFARDPNSRFDRDIEGLSIKEGIDWLHSKYTHISLIVPIAGHLSWYYLHPDDTYVYDIGQADSVIIINKQTHIIDSELKQFEKSKHAFTLVYTIKRGKAVFGWVYRRTTAL